MKALTDLCRRAHISFTVMVSCLFPCASAFAVPEISITSPVSAAHYNPSTWAPSFTCSDGGSSCATGSGSCQYSHVNPDFPDRLASPNGIASDGAYLYVLDTNNHRIVKRLASDLSFVVAVGSQGSGNDQFDFPYGITSDGTYLYVTDWLNHRIVKRLASDLSFVAAIGSQGSGNDQFDLPYGITNDGTYLYVVDPNNQRIVKRLASDLSFVAAIGSPGSGIDGFSTPRGITSDGTYLYVADAGNHRIVKRLASDLSFVAAIGSQGSGNDEFNDIKEITSDGTYLYVADTFNHRIVKRLASDLSFVAAIGSQGSGNDEFYYPSSIASDGTYLYVADNSNNRIVKRLASDLSFVETVGRYGSLTALFVNIDCSNGGTDIPQPDRGVRTLYIRAMDGSGNWGSWASVTFTSYPPGSCGDGIVGRTWTARESYRNWFSITSSSDGTKLAAVANGGQIFTSTDSGVTWTARENNRSWYSITSSSDGTKLAAVVSGGQIYTSTDSGVSWTARESTRNWVSVTSSSDGTKLAAVVSGGQIYTSTDSGTTWTARESNRNWWSITSSSDGTKLAAVEWEGQIYTSIDSGATWMAQESDRFWYSITSSSDGTKLAAVVYGGQIYTSTDSGAIWTAQASNRDWASITSSSDGTKLAAMVYGGQIYTSIDSGATWTAQENSREWSSITSSSDGIKLAAVVDGGQIYTSATEQCDDGNASAGDGCSDSCQIESGYSCSGVPNVCVLLPPAVTHTATPTPLPTNPPTVPPPPPPSLAIGVPQDSPGNNQTVLSKQRVTLSGTGTVGQTIGIQVDGILVGTVPVQASGSLAAGRWQFELPPLATGEREIVIVIIDQVGNRSAPSTPTKLVVLDVAPLDFAGTGDSAIAAFRRVGDTIRFKTRTASESTWSNVEMTGRYPAPADYDNDGISDVAAVAVVKGKLQWNMKLSSTGEMSTASLGSRGDTILSGCHFESDQGASLATFRSERRELVFTSYNGFKERVVHLAKLSRGDLLGCGDIDSDGRDEILFRVRGVRKQSAAVAAFDTSGNRKMFTGYNKFLRGFVVRRAGTQVPLVAVLGGTTANGRQVKITTMAGSFAFPLFYISRSATIGTGIFTHGTNEQVPGLFWADNRSGVVYRRLLKEGAQTITLFNLPDGYTLIRSQNVMRTGATS